MTPSEALGPLREFLAVPLVTIGGARITVGALLTFGVVLLLAWGLSRLLQGALSRALRPRHGQTEMRKGIEVTRRLVHYGVMTLGIALGLHVMGINLAALFAAGAVLAVAVGFAMQNIAQNFVSGLILLVERSIQPGDVLEVEGRVVRVVDMRIRSTVCRSRDEEEFIVPNSVLVQSTVKNFTLRDDLLRLRVEVGVVYGSDMALVRRVLEETAASFEGRTTRYDPVVLLKRFGSSSVDFEVSVWTEDPWRAPKTLSDLHEAVWWSLREAGVTIAFPQLDVHFDEDALSALRPRSE